MLRLLCGISSPRSSVRWRGLFFALGCYWVWSSRLLGYILLGAGGAGYLMLSTWVYESTNVLWIDRSCCVTIWMIGSFMLNSFLYIGKLSRTTAFVSLISCNCLTCSLALVSLNPRSTSTLRGACFVDSSEILSAIWFSSLIGSTAIV